MDPHKTYQLHQGHQDNLLGKSHCKHKDTKQRGLPVKPLLSQHIPCHGRHHADNEHRDAADKYAVPQPLESRILHQLVKVLHGGT